MDDDFLTELGEFLTGSTRYEDNSVFLIDKDTFYRRLEILVETLDIEEKDIKILKQVVINDNL